MGNKLYLNNMTMIIREGASANKKEKDKEYLNKLPSKEVNSLYKSINRCIITPFSISCSEYSLPLFVHHYQQLHNNIHQFSLLLPQII